MINIVPDLVFLLKLMFLFADRSKRISKKIMVAEVDSFRRFGEVQFAGTVCVCVSQYSFRLFPRKTDESIVKCN